MMSKIKLLIADEDTAYCQALATQIALTSGEFSVSVYNENRSQTLKDNSGYCCGQDLEMFSQRFDLLLIGEDTLISEVSEMKAVCKPIRLLAQESDGTEKDQWSWFPKYGRVSELVSFLLMVHAQFTGKRRALIGICGAHAKLTGFLSGSGGTGKTCAALAFCRYLAREREKQVLYLSLEELDGAA